MHHLCFVFFLADRIVQELCCETALKDKMCTSGINIAKGQLACDALFINTCDTKSKKVGFYLCACIVCMFLHDRFFFC